MRPALVVLSIIVLIANLAPSVMYLQGRLNLVACKDYMLFATVVWYIVGGALIYGTKPAKLEEPVVP